MGDKRQVFFYKNHTLPIFLANYPPEKLAKLEKRIKKHGGEIRDKPTISGFNFCYDEKYPHKGSKFRWYSEQLIHEWIGFNRPINPLKYLVKGTVPQKQGKQKTSENARSNPRK